MSDEKPGCLGFILQTLGLMPKQSTPIKEVFPYAQRDDFLSPSELSFHRILDQIVGNKAIICPKVSLKDIFFVTDRDRSKQTTYSNKIDRKHVDFLLCSKDSLKPICGIELDDSSHKREDRIIRDKFFEQVFVTAGLKLIRFENKKSYSLSEIEAKMQPVFEPKSNNLEIPKSVVDLKENVAVVETAATSSTPVAPKCKKCGLEMILRQAKKGDNVGQAFYGCPNFPKCRETVQVESSKDC